MKWLQSGVAKSGNLWLYNILQSIARHAGLEQTSFIRRQPIHAIAKDWDLSFPGQADIDILSINPKVCLYRISGIFNMPIADIDAYVSQASHVWTQSYFSEMAARVIPKFQKTIYIIRDPRDVAVSMSRYSLTPYRTKYFPEPLATPEAFLDAILFDTTAGWVRHVAGYLKHHKALNIHMIFYENLLADFDGELRKLLDYLGVKLDGPRLEAVQSDVRFETMKGKNPQHVRKGAGGEWPQSMTPKQAALAARIGGPLMKNLGYSLDSKNGTPPRIPADLTPERIDRILVKLERQMLLEKTFNAVRRAFAKDSKAGVRAETLETE